MKLGIDKEDLCLYAKTFIDRKIRQKILHRMTAKKLQALGIVMGDWELILNYLKGEIEKNNLVEVVLLGKKLKREKTRRRSQDF